MQLGETGGRGPERPCDEADPQQQDEPRARGDPCRARRRCRADGRFCDELLRRVGDADRGCAAWGRALVGVGDRQRRGVAVAERELHHGWPGHRRRRQARPEGHRGPGARQDRLPVRAARGEPGRGVAQLRRCAAEVGEPAGPDVLRAGAAGAEGRQGGRFERQGRCLDRRGQQADERQDRLDVGRAGRAAASDRSRQGAAGPQSAEARPGPARRRSAGLRRDRADGCGRPDGARGGAGEAAGRPAGAVRRAGECFEHQQRPLERTEPAQQGPAGRDDRLQADRPVTGLHRGARAGGDRPGGRLAAPRAPPPRAARTRLPSRRRSRPTSTRSARRRASFRPTRRRRASTRARSPPTRTRSRPTRRRSSPTS